VIDATFPRAWISGPYSKFREGVLLDREKAQLPASQYLVRNYKLCEALATQLKNEEAEKHRIKRRLREIEITKWNVKNRINRIMGSRYHSDGLFNEGEGALEQRSFVRACPVDGCRGFLSSALKCGTCETYACGECFGVIGKERRADHTCTPGDIETAKYIKKVARPCPTCAINISKIDGCDQMYCVQCRTAFSWRTGMIVTGTIHNPHYFEMLRNASANGEIPRQPGDDGQCPRQITDPGVLTMRLYDALRAGMYKRGDVFDDIMKMQRHICHLFRDTIPALRNHPTDTADLRMHYLLGTMDEPTFKRKLVLREKAIERDAALLACYRARVEMTIDVFQAYIRRELPEKDVLLRLKSMEDMMTTFLQELSKRFNCAVEIGPCLSLINDDDALHKKQRIM
jgi:hypothetical protein